MTAPLVSLRDLRTVVNDMSTDSVKNYSAREGRALQRNVRATKKRAEKHYASRP